MNTKQPPLIAHIIYRLSIGGLENGLVNLINQIPISCCRHVIICLKDYTEFSARIHRDDVEIYSLHKREGNDLKIFLKLWRLLWKIRPDIVHTRNLSTLECQLPAFLAGIPRRIHSEHGRDMGDLDGSNIKYIILRKMFRPLIHTYVPLSRDIESWLCEKIRVSQSKITQIYNGVDTERFVVSERQQGIFPEGFSGVDDIVIGSVGRMDPVKDQLTLAKAFIYIKKIKPDMFVRLRLVLVGDGIMRDQIRLLMIQAGVETQVWFAGDRDDIPELMNCFNIFVLPSRNEGVSNTILEAMASGLPVVATAVGGNSELVQEGKTGYLVLSNDEAEMANAILAYAHNPMLMTLHGAAARQYVEDHFSINRMVRSYMELYGAV